MNRKQVIVLAIVVIMLLIGIFVSRLVISGRATQTQQKFDVTKENLGAFLQITSLIKELPEDARISFKTYNFDSGIRTWEKFYILTKGKVYESDEDNVDAVVFLHSKYISGLGINFCQTIKEAKSKGDFGFEIKKSKAGLLWKYRGMISYKKCFGF